MNSCEHRSNLLEIAANDVSSETSVVELGDNMHAFAKCLTATTDVRQVVILQMYFRDGAASAFPVDAGFNDMVYVYNKYMYDACNSFETISFWSLGGIWANWQQYLCDGIHYNLGHRKYYNSVKGAVIAAANKLV